MDKISEGGDTHCLPTWTLFGQGQTVKNFRPSELLSFSTPVSVASARSRAPIELPRLALRQFGCVGMRVWTVAKQINKNMSGGFCDVIILLSVPS